MNHPFAVPSHLPHKLAQIHAYWGGLVRGQADIPFYDDFKPTDVPALADTLLLIDVFKKPERFRAATVGQEIGAVDLEGHFLDERPSDWPLEFFRSQCVATVECMGPTFFRHNARDDSGTSYSRLLLPMWGDGRIGMLVGAVSFG